MSKEPTEKDEVLAEVRAMRDDLSSIKLLLGGDWRDNAKPGLLHSHKAAMEEIYNGEKGILVRLARLELTKVQAIAYGSGASAVVALVFWLLLSLWK